MHIRIQIRVPTGKKDRVLGGPPARHGVIVASPEARQAGVGVVKTTGETKGLEPRRRISEHVAKLIVVDALRDTSIGNIHHHTHATEVVHQEPVDLTALAHVVGHMWTRGVDERRDHRVVRSELRDWLERSGVQ